MRTVNQEQLMGNAEMAVKMIAVVVYVTDDDLNNCCCEVDVLWCALELVSSG